MRRGGGFEAGVGFGGIVGIVGGGRQEECLAGVDEIRVVRWRKPVPVDIDEGVPVAGGFCGGGGSIPCVRKGRLSDAPEAVTRFDGGLGDSLLLIVILHRRLR